MMTKRMNLRREGGRVLYVLLFLLLSATVSHAQETRLSGRVTDESQNPIAGASVVLQGSQRGFVTTATGEFNLTVPGPDAVIEVSFLGYQPVVTTVGNRTFLEIELIPASQAMDEVVVVGYGTQSRSSLTSAISTVKADDLVNAPVQNISNSIQGRVAGVIMTQNSGRPGGDAANINIRGVGTIGNNAPLCIVDGVPRDFNKLDPNSIESISVLKDAAAVAPYGMAGANGVILVTTKQGATGKPVIEYSGYYGIQNATHMHELASSYHTALIRNDAARNSGLTVMPYDDTALQNLKLASEGKSPDPDLYNNVNFFDEAFSKNNPMTGHNISISGGSEYIKFYTGLGYKYQKGMTSPVSNTRYNITQNLDAQVTQNLRAGVNLNLTIDKTSRQYLNDWNIYETAFMWDPAMPLYYSNGGQAASLEKGTTPDAIRNGYVRDSQYQIFTQIFLEQQLPFLPGLSAKAVFSYDPTFNLNSSWKVNGGDYYRIDTSSGEKKFNLVKASELSSLSETNKLDQSYTYQAMLNYKRSFGKHDVSGIFVYEFRNGDHHRLMAGRSNYLIDSPVIDMGSGSKVDWENSGGRSKYRQLGMVVRATYAYDGKYMVEFAGRRDGHYFFAPGKDRFGYFPSVSAAWRVSEEKFIKERNIGNVINNLKIRASWGQSGGMPNTSAYQYLQSYSINQMSYPWGDQTGIGFSEGIQANPNITWEKSNQTDIGLDLGLWNGLLNLEFDWYHQKRTDMLASPAVTVPGEYGIGLAQVNAAEMHTSGIEFTLGSRKRFANGLTVFGTATFSYAKDEVDQNFENSATYDNPQRRRTGRSLDAFSNGKAWGYEAVGLYTENDLTLEGGKYVRKDGVKVPYDIHPGDIMYKDQNGDKELNPEGDEVCIMEYIRPQINYGLQLGAQWKGFDVSLLFQGAARSKTYLMDDLVMPFMAGARGVVKAATDYWTPENTGARFPRVYNGGQNPNNSVNSSWYVANAAYCRLKNVEIGYTLPQAWMDRIGIRSIRVYLSGQNLFTIAGEIKDYIDPEIFTTDITNSRGYYYPQQRVFSAGLNITF